MKGKRYTEEFKVEEMYFVKSSTVSWKNKS